MKNKATGKKQAVMTTKIEIGKQLLEIRKKLSVFGSKESSFINVELLFYESLTLARTHADDPLSNELLSDLKHLESTLYKNTRELYLKTNQKEVAIRRFMVQFKIILATAAKKFLSKVEKSQTHQNMD
ncbi:MAG: hypothetical protein ACXWCZ_00370 [Flavisolibacter sp.]